MHKHGRPVLGAITGLLFGISLSLGLAVIVGVSLSSDVLGVLPPAFLILGIVWGIWAPLARHRTGAVQS